MLSCTGLVLGTDRGKPEKQAISRAIPSTLKQSARFGVKSTSITVSSRLKYSRIFVPTGALAGNSIKPSAESASPSSCSEHSMPCDGSDFLILKLPGKTAPTTATGIHRFGRTFAAPHTIANASSVSSTDTVQTRNLSALGCFSTVKTFPTTTPENSAAAFETESTSNPAIVSFAANCSVGME